MEVHFQTLYQIELLVKGSARSLCITLSINVCLLWLEQKTLHAKEQAAPWLGVSGVRWLRIEV